MSAKHNYRGLKARKLGKLNGKAVYRWPVHVTSGERAALLQDADGYAHGDLWVIAHTAQDAADYVRRLTWGKPYIEIEVWGVKGGLAKHRYSGFESAIWQEMCREQPTHEQPSLLDSDALAQVSLESQQAESRRRAYIRHWVYNRPNPTPMSQD